jgi:hypothetical protein
MAQLKLNAGIIGRGDLLRLSRELNALNDFFIGARARSPAQAAALPKTSKLLEQLAADNQHNLLDEQQRLNLVAELKQLEDKAPSVHISFAAEPTPKTLQPLVVWLRENIHPDILLSVGYQPRIAAGCIVRTPNKIFDLSMGAYLAKQTPLLTKLIAGSIDGN